MTKALTFKVSLILYFIFGCKMQSSTDVPNFSAKLFHGDSVNLQTVSKNRIFLLNVWSTFCPPCLKELPILEKINAKYKPNQKFTFMTLALNSEAELIQFTESTDTTNPYNKVFRHSGLRRLDLPVIPSLTHGYIVNQSSDGTFSATLGNNKEVKLLNKMFEMEGIPVTLLYNSNGKIVYRSNGSITDDRVITKKIDSLLATN